MKNWFKAHFCKKLAYFKTENETKKKDCEQLDDAKIEKKKVTILFWMKKVRVMMIKDYQLLQQ